MNKLLPIKNIYNDFQNIGTDIGMYVTFVVIGACNKKCFFCNTDFKITDCKQNYPIGLATEKINSFAKETNYIVFTGGEPLLFLDIIILLTLEFKSIYRYKISIETNGTIELTDNQYSLFNNVIISPKAWSNSLKLKNCHCLKLLYPYKYVNVYPEFAIKFYTSYWYCLQPILLPDELFDDSILEQTQNEVKRLGYPWRLCI
jgi:organic radical activating enzyme